ncbi:MAG: single-stranded-DNA-specific exonuclease RecJ [Chitinivibrionales bacterium]
MRSGAFPTPREVVGLKAVDAEHVKSLASQLNVSPLLATILAARGLRTFDECKRFFRPGHTHFNDPFLLDGMEKAVDRIAGAINQGEKITIYGDYDVDGVTSTALMVRVLRHLGARCDFYLPNRLTEGYGVSVEGIDAIAEGGTTLIVTVDCGITSFKPVSQAKKHGIEMIITDHHAPHEHIPDALSVINPKLCSYPDQELAGVGVALKLCQALVRHMQQDEYVWHRHLDLVALGTAADIVPLVGENRVIVKLGYEQIEKTRNVGLQQLLTIQDIAHKSISTREVVFGIAPCINAAGRLGDPTRGVKLLLTEDAGEALLYAKELLQANKERQALDKHVQGEAIHWVLDNCHPDKDFALVAADRKWHVGVIGIAASKLVERFYRPTFLFSIDKNGMAKGSGRSIPGIHLLDLLHQCRDCLENYGGHSAAAGASIRAENLETFRRRLAEAVEKSFQPDHFYPKVMADAQVTIASLTPRFFSILKQMEPFGPGNMRPVLLCRELTHRYEPKIVGKNHLKMTVTSQGVVMDAIAFNFGDRFSEIQKANGFSLAFSLDQNDWQGKLRLQMKVKGIAV